MKTERAYINQIRELYPRDKETSPKTVELVDEAVRTFPKSPELWILRGCLIQLTDADCLYDLDDALNSLKKAVELDSTFDDAWKEIGHFYNAVKPNRKLSLEAFKRAKDLRQTKL